MDSFKKIGKAEFCIKGDEDGFSAEIMGSPVDIAYLLSMAIAKNKNIGDLMEAAINAVKHADERTKNN